jgi:hypothetical protein
VLYPATVSAQAITAVTSPSSATTIKAANDFATRAFQDPWDMNQKTDVGPFLGSNDAGSNGWAPGFAFSNGLFSGTTAAGDAQLWFLDTGNPFAAPLGKTGANFPIDASTYKVFAFRMIRPAGAAATQAQVLTWPNTIYESSPTAHFTGSLPGGPGVYFINLDVTSPAGAPGSGNWIGLQRALRLQPTSIAGESLSFDWARLVQMGANSCQPIAWTGGIAPDNVADIYVDTDTDLSNGYYGVVQRFATTTALGTGSRASAGCPVVSGAFNFNIGALPVGTYYALVAPLNVAPTAANSKYSAGSWTIADMPTFKFTSPGDEGSSDDFATSQMGDAWDFDKVADADTLYNINNPQIVTLQMEAPDGSALPNQRVFMGASAPAGGCPGSAGDPVMMMTDFSKRGKTFLIDTNRYRLLTVEFGMPNKARDVNCGSIARVVWHKKGDGVSTFTVSDDMIFNSRVGVNLLDKITVDLGTLNTEPRSPNDPPNPNWTNGPGGGVDAFRFDPLEFSTATNFYVKRIKLADYERAKTSYTITWTYSKSVGTVDLYYDADNNGFNGTEITPGPIEATLGTFTWNIPANLPTAGGTPYYIYAVFSDAPGCAPSWATCSTNQVYAPLPILIDSNYVQRGRLVLSRKALNYGAVGNTSTTTVPQTVRLTFVGPAETTPCWTISNSNLNFSVTPASGTGNGTVTVALVPQVFPGGGVGVATFTVNECQAGVSTMLNPGQTFSATYRISSVGALPVGAVDTPDNNVTVAGSVGITGWVVDDIDIATVKIYREPVAGETGRVFLGDASRVDDARSDIEVAYPDKPFNYRAGWGYLVLTNFLPNLGNGPVTFSVYATDRDGHEVLLGQRTVMTANSLSTTPFGAIDTPGQGETISGSNYNNFGWVLVRGQGPSGAHADPPHGGVVTVAVDGAFIGSPFGWVPRSDLSASFSKAEYDGIDNALGVFVLNTAAYADGVHTISWVVVATNGKAAGIGSRFFTTVNGNNLTATDASVNLGRQAREVAALDRSSGVRATRSGSVKPESAIAADPTGLRTVYGRHLERVVVDASMAGAHQYEAYHVVDGTLRALPAGASFDDRRGILYWQPGLGYVGDYDFVVVGDGKARIPVRVVLSPETTRAPVSRLVRGLFATN